MPTKIYFSEAKSTLDDAAEDLTASTRQLDIGKDNINRADATLNNMGQKYSDMKANISYTASLNPDNPAWQNIDAEMDELLKDRQTLKNYSNSLVAAIAGVPEPNQS